MTTFATFADILVPYILDADWASIQHLPISAIKTDSRQVQKADENGGDVFVLLSVNPAIKDKAKAFITPLQAVAVLSEIAPSEMGFSADELASLSFPIIYIKDLRLILGDFVKAFLQAQQAVNLPQVLAVTGTNGKTTISQLVAQLGELSDKPSAIMGTAGNGRWGQLTASTHTTSEVTKVHEFLHRMGIDGVAMVALEASSHGLHQHRLQGVDVSVAVFSNLSRDHLDYHTDMDEYGQAKARLFDRHYFEYLSHAVINLDDDFGANLAKTLSNNKNLTVWTYSTTDADADFFAENITPSLDGVSFTLHSPFGKVTLNSPLLGLFNVANLLASIAGFLAMYPDDFDKLPHIVSKLVGAKGRMQVVAKNKAGAVFIVDYAHTPDALTQVLASLKAHCTGDLWAVFGCGGDRDKGKRPLMTKAGLQFADKVILTADNPRSENPLDILKDMQAGLNCNEHYKIVIEPDRKHAIELAIKHAKSGDIVAILGKGHETYQEIQGVRYDFDDAQVVGEMVGCWKK